MRFCPPFVRQIFRLQSEFELSQRYSFLGPTSKASLAEEVSAAENHSNKYSHLKVELFPTSDYQNERLLKYLSDGSSNFGDY